MSFDMSVSPRVLIFPWMVCLSLRGTFMPSGRLAGSSPSNVLDDSVTCLKYAKPNGG